MTEDNTRTARLRAGQAVALLRPQEPLDWAALIDPNPIWTAPDTVIWTAPETGTWRLTLGRQGPVEAELIGVYDEPDLPAADTRHADRRLAEIRERVARDHEARVNTAPNPRFTAEDVRRMATEVQGRYARGGVIPVPEQMLREQPAGFLGGTIRPYSVGFTTGGDWQNWIVPRELAETALRMATAAPFARVTMGPPDGPDGPPPVKIPLKLKPPLCACGDPTNLKWEHMQDACDFLDS